MRRQAAPRIDLVPDIWSPQPGDAKLLHPFASARLLRFTRAPDGARCNGGIGGTDCAIFPGLHERHERMHDESEEEWASPFSGAEVCEKGDVVMRWD